MKPNDETPPGPGELFKPRPWLTAAVRDVEEVAHHHRRAGVDPDVLPALLTAAGMAQAVALLDDVLVYRSPGIPPKLVRRLLTLRKMADGLARELREVGQR